MSRGRGGLVRAIRWLLLLVVVLALFVAGTLVPYLWPETDDPSRADAVMILSGDHGERLPQALRLMDERVAPTLVFLGTLDRAMEDELCQGGRVPYEVLCVRPNPDSTRHEARAARDLVRKRGWRSIVVVTSTHHITRSSVLFRRCVDGTVDMVAGRPAFTTREMARQIRHEWLATVHAMVIDRGC
jgi:uncharacterized SAM-binding protein YcdF (DUF218 family)